MFTLLEMINRYLPKMEYIYTQGRVSDLKNKTTEQLKSLKDLGKFINLALEDCGLPLLKTGIPRT